MRSESTNNSTFPTLPLPPQKWQIGKKRNLMEHLVLTWKINNFYTATIFGNSTCVIRTIPRLEELAIVARVVAAFQLEAPCLICHSEWFGRWIVGAEYIQGFHQAYKYLAMFISFESLVWSYFVVILLWYLLCHLGAIIFLRDTGTGTAKQGCFSSGLKLRTSWGTIFFLKGHPAPAMVSYCLIIWNIEVFLFDVNILNTGKHLSTCV